MKDDQRRILDMLEQGKVSAEQAERLLDAIDTGDGPAPHSPKSKPRFLRVAVRQGINGDGSNQSVDVRVPLQILRAGMKLGAIIPQAAQEQINTALSKQGMSFNIADLNLDPKALEELIDSLADLEVNVNDEGQSVRVYCE